MSISPKRNQLVSCSTDGTVRVWRLGWQEPARVLRGHAGAVAWCTWSPKGKWIITGSADGSARIWPAGKPPARSDQPDNETVPDTLPQLRRAMWNATSECLTVDLRRSLLGASAEGAATRATGAAPPTSSRAVPSACERSTSTSCR